jgi:hypothetical protein
MAQLADSLVTVYAYRFLCRLGDNEDRWGKWTPRARMLKAHTERAIERFETVKPRFVAGVFENNWDGANVYSNPKGAVWYDCDAFPGTLIGFLAKRGHNWAITTSFVRQTGHIVAGQTVIHNYLSIVENGEYKEQDVSYVVDDRTMTPAEFLLWKVPAVNAYLDKCQREQNERARQNEIAAAQRRQKQAELDAQIAAKLNELEELRKQRNA